MPKNHDFQDRLKALIDARCVLLFLLKELGLFNYNEKELQALTQKAAEALLHRASVES